MSHVLRAAVAATSLFTCPACVTTDSLDQNVAKPSGTESARTATSATLTTSVASAASAASTAPATSATAPAPTASAAAPASATLTAVPDGTATLLAWAQAQPVPGTTRGVSSLMFEQSDSPLRLVLSLSDPARSAADVAAGGASTAGMSTAGATGAVGASTEIAAPVGWANVSAPLAIVAPSANAPKVPGLDLVALDAPAAGSPGEFFGRLLLAESHNTPEPGTLALAVLGLCALRVTRRPARKKRAEV